MKIVLQSMSMALKSHHTKLDSLYTYEIIERDTSEFEKLLRTRDQKYRGNREIDWNKQNEFDLQNRLSIDSVYGIHNSLKHFTKGDIDAISFVIHHASDCDWVYKWLELLYLEKEKGHIESLGIAYYPAIERMLGNEGYCTETDSIDRNKFLNRIDSTLRNFYLNNIKN